MLDDLMNFGYVTGAYLGVMVSDMDPETASYYGLPVGAYIQEVTSGYCAEEAGLLAKDIIVKLGDYEVENVTDLTRALRNFKAGDTTLITVYRGGAKMELSITLDEKPANLNADIPAEMPEGQMPESGSYEEWFDFFFGGRE
jgi:serine protease Do